MFHSRATRTTMVCIWLLGLGLLCFPAAGRDVELVLHPQKASAAVGKFSLLPPESAKVDGDAVPLYEKAIKSLPDKAGDEQIQEWSKMSIGQLPLDAAEQGLTPYMESLQYVAKAAKCRQCSWPQWKPGEDMGDLSGYRRLAFAIRLWAKLEIADERYEGAAVALQTGFGMSRHLGLAPTIIQGLIGAAVGELMCAEVEEFIQGENAPNLYISLSSLPRPFVEMENAIEAEKKAAGAQDALLGQIDEAQDRWRMIAKRFDRSLAALQCVEAIRSYSASHSGKLPKNLAEILEVPVPTDPLYDASFQYSVTGSTAVLESAPPAGDGEKGRIRYESSVPN